MQILLDDERYERLHRRAASEGRSVGAFVRAAIDVALEDDVAVRRRAAADALLAAPPLPVPSDPRELRRELDEHLEREPWPEPR